MCLSAASIGVIKRDDADLMLCYLGTWEPSYCSVAVGVFYTRVCVCVCARVHGAAVLPGHWKGFLESSLVGIYFRLCFTIHLERNRRIMRPSLALAAVSSLPSGNNHLHQ